MNSRLFFHRHLVGAVLFGVVFLSLNSKFQFAQPKEFNATHYQLSAPFFKFATAGFWPAAVDALWIQTIQKIGSANYHPSTIPAVKDFYRLATDLDPNFYELYEQAGVLFLFFYEAGGPAREVLEKGIEVYERGNVPAAFWTHPYTLYIFLANVYAFQLNDWPKAKETYLRAADVPGSPPYLQNMREWLSKEGSEKVLAKRVLQQLVQNTEDPLIRSKYEEKLKQYEN